MNATHLTPEDLLVVLERANLVASYTHLDDLLDRMLDLILDVCQAEAGSLSLYERATDELVFKLVKEGEASHKLIGVRFPAGKGIAGATVSARQPILVPDLAHDPRWNRDLAARIGRPLHNLLSVPLLSQGQPVGVVQVFNFQRPEVQLVQLLSNRMASEIEKSLLLEASQARSRRLQALVDIIGHIGSTLDRDELLRLIIEYASQLLDCEAASLFLVDDATGELVLHIATNKQKAELSQVRLAPGEGIIGYVARTGETVMVNDVHQDQRHFAGVDLQSGFETRSILAVPLHTRTVTLGSEMGVARQRIIGGLEALNKRQGIFTYEDAELLQTLANQAATVLQIVRLYGDANDLFFGVISSLSAAIDAKDPYTEGHSRRVSEFSVAIARQMGLPQEEIHHLRIASLLHDVGKIGIPDEILKKPGRLTVEEYAEIKRHPMIGENIMGAVRMLQQELPGIAQHHERIDGAGYPNRLRGEEISPVARIVAVADVFDALTSSRPYRLGQPAAQVIAYLFENAGTQFDRQCVEALKCAYERGWIQPQNQLVVA